MVKASSAPTSTPMATTTSSRTSRTGTTRLRTSRIFRNGRPLAVAEVKQWDEYVDPMPPGGSVGMVDLKQLYRPVRKAVGSAAPQLKAHLAEGLPLVALLTNPKGFPIALDDEDVRFALSGNPTVTFRVDPETGGRVGDVEHVFGRDGGARPTTEFDPGLHAYISAVAVARGRRGSRRPTSSGLSKPCAASGVRRLGRWSLVPAVGASPLHAPSGWPRR
jgi:hypothetical protein